MSHSSWKGGKSLQEPQALQHLHVGLFWPELWPEVFEAQDLVQEKFFMEIRAQAEKECFHLVSWHQVPLLTQEEGDTLGAAQIEQG